MTAQWKEWIKMIHNINRKLCFHNYSTVRSPSTWDWLVVQAGKVTIQLGYELNQVGFLSSKSLWIKSLRFSCDHHKWLHLIYPFSKYLDVRATKSNVKGPLECSFRHKTIVKLIDRISCYRSWFMFPKPLESSFMHCNLVCTLHATENDGMQTNFYLLKTPQATYK